MNPRNPPCLFRRPTSIPTCCEVWDMCQARQNIHDGWRPRILAAITPVPHRPRLLFVLCSFSVPSLFSVAFGLGVTPLPPRAKLSRINKPPLDPPTSFTSRDLLCWHNHSSRAHSLLACVQALASPSRTSRFSCLAARSASRCSFFFRRML